jgi:hypothetical protein
VVVVGGDEASVLLYDETVGYCYWVRVLGVPLLAAPACARRVAVCVTVRESGTQESLSMLESAEAMSVLSLWSSFRARTLFSASAATESAACTSLMYCLDVCALPALSVAVTPVRSALALQIKCVSQPAMDGVTSARFVLLDVYLSVSAPRSSVVQGEVVVEAELRPLPISFPAAGEEMLAFIVRPVGSQESPFQRASGSENRPSSLASMHSSSWAAGGVFGREGAKLRIAPSQAECSRLCDKELAVLQETLKKVQAALDGRRERFPEGVFSPRLADSSHGQGLASRGRSLQTHWSSSTDVQFSLKTSWMCENTQTPRQVFDCIHSVPVLQIVQPLLSIDLGACTIICDGV